MRTTFTAPRLRRATRADLAVIGGFFVLSAAIYRGLLAGGYLTNSAQDQNMWEWFFAVTAKSVLHGESPLFSALQNHPLGVNLMANTSMLGLGVPLTPVTALFGPGVSWTIVLVGGLGGTAAAWYWVLHRDFGRSRVAAAIAGGFCAFAPSTISHANAHPNFVALFVLPFVVRAAVRVCRGTRPVRDGAVLGALAAYQVLLGEEPLLIAAVTLLVFGFAYGLRFRDQWRTIGTAFAVAAGVGLALVGYPLYWQFFGAQSYSVLPHTPFGNDLKAFTALASDSIGGDGTGRTAGAVSLNRTEENAFFGWPLVVLVTVLACWLWRDRLARALTITIVAMAALSLGTVLVVDGTVTRVPGPSVLLFSLPLFDSLLLSRFALACVPAIALLLALATDRVLAARVSTTDVPVRLLWFGALAAVLLPIAPTPLQTHERPPVPRYFADGTWRQHVRPGGSVVVVPLPSPGDAEPLHWQVEAGLGFPLAGGYFVGPSGSGRTGGYGGRQPQLAGLLENVGKTGEVPAVDDRLRDVARADLRFWRADVVVLPRRHENAAQLRETLDRLLPSPGRPAADVWIWDRW